MKRKSNHSRNRTSQKKLTKQKASIHKINEILSLLGLDENKSSTDKKDLKKKENSNIHIKKNKEYDISENIFNEPNINKDLDEAQFIKTENNNKKGLVNKEYIMNKLKEKNIFNKNEFYLQNVNGDGNCGYRCISLQIYGTENEYASIRKEIFNYLDKNRNIYKEFNFEYNNKILSSNDYINIIKND